MTTLRSFAPRRGLVAMTSGWNDLAIDPGKHTGWALFAVAVPSGPLVACGTGEPPFDTALRNVMIELPQNYPSNPVPPQDLITLAFLAGRYANAARGDASVVHTIFPHEWKGNLPKPVCEARVRARLTPGELGIVAALEAPKGEMNNVWDAIGIGLVAFRKIKL
jgi:hypothetical protein